MVQITKSILGLQRVGLRFDPTVDVFFEAIVMENMRKLAGSKTANALFTAMENGTPARRGPGMEGQYNVLIQPTLSREWVAPGMGRGGITDSKKYDDWYYGKGGKLIPKMASKIQAQADYSTESKRAPEGDGTGSSATVFYNNNEILTKDGTWLPPFTTLAHELIHCLHYVDGSAFGGRDEEWRTVGIKGYEGETICENKIRAELGVETRKTYFADD